jgi:hypothetical protein
LKVSLDIVIRFCLFLLGLPIETAAKLIHFGSNKKSFFTPNLPALICTLGTVGTSLGVAAVKNRYGRADAGGTLMTWLAFNPEYMYVEDIPENS